MRRTDSFPKRIEAPLASGEPGSASEPEAGRVPRNPIFATFACCASTNVPTARRRSVINEASFLFMGRYLPAQRLCHKTESLKIVNLWMKTGKGTSHSCYSGVADLIQ